MNGLKLEKIHMLAQEVFHISRNELILSLRFLDSVISLLEIKLAEIDHVATNGKEIGYNPHYILKVYKAEKYGVTRIYLHSILHCVFSHPFVDSLVDHDCWNLACDIAVENIINELQIQCADGIFRQEQDEFVSILKQNLKVITAEKIYRYLLDAKLTKNEISRLHNIFARDDHDVWYQTQSAFDEPSSKPNGECADEDGAGAGSGSGFTPLTVELQAKIRENWRQASQKMKVDMETFSKAQGFESGALTQNLRAVTREKYEYSRFLKRFSVLGETMRINDEEFDYIFYTYGLQLYGKMPLIEPLEYKEVRRIKEFVIAVDTSGSVSGELVQRFIQKTYNILSSENSFFQKITLYFIQCDAEIQEIIKISSMKDFEKYLKKMVLKGFGGTDFRPVFSFIEQLRKQGDLANLKGMIYFTDGYGTFPASKPDYDVAFIFVDDDAGSSLVPPWVIKLLLSTEELETI